MSLKKILTYSVVSASLLTGVACAGGPDVIAQPACPVCITGFVPFAYLGVSAGWAYSNWNSFILSGAGSDTDTNGFSAGGKIGYQFLDNFGIEGGGFILPDSDQNVFFAANPPFPGFTISGEVDSWFAYGAATIRSNVPFVDPFFYVMGKVGGVYRALNHSGELYENVGNGNYATVIFGATLEYDLAGYHLPIALGVDYYYIPGSEDSFFKTSNLNNDNDMDDIINKNAAPAAQVVVGTISLHFAV